MMTTADCIESLHRAMCDTFNADCVTKSTKSDQQLDEDKTLVKAKIAHAESMLIKEDYTTTANHEADQKQKPIKIDEALVVSNEPTMELLFSSMSSTFDTECATGTDEAGSLLNHDLAEDKTIKWRNLVNNKFAYKDNITYKRGRRLKKPTTKSISKFSTNINRNNNYNKSKQKQSEKQTRKSVKKLVQTKILGQKSSRSLPASTCLREGSTPSDDEDSQQLDERTKSGFVTNDFFESELTICKEELITGDDDILLLAADTNMLPGSRKRYRHNQDNSNSTQLKEQPEEILPDGILIKLETIKEDIDDCNDNSMSEGNYEPSGLAVKDACIRLTNKSRSETELSDGKESRTRKIKQKAVAVVKKVIGKSKRKKKIKG